MGKNEKKYLIALQHFPKFGPASLNRLKKYFSDAESAFRASEADLLKSGIEAKTAAEFIKVRSRINPDKIIEKIEKEKIKTVLTEDENYPRLLKEIYAPPPLLYYRGDLSGLAAPAIAVVGARKYSNYGRQAVEEIVFRLAKQGLHIVSGLAFGIDTLSHSACLSADGKTTAVLGTGIDRNSIYPSANLRLAERIIETGGALISEFPPETPPLRFNFPRRNRIISGLSLGTLVIEAGEKSGALITARYALEQNRDVFAVPGGIFWPMSAGPNELIKQGAKTITCAKDILETLAPNRGENFLADKKIIAETAEEEAILKYLSHEGKHINELTRLSGLSTAAAGGTLSLMEIKGMVKNLGNMEYVLGD